jgi:hypothetical protein
MLKFPSAAPREGASSEEVVPRSRDGAAYRLLRRARGLPTPCAWLWQDTTVPSGAAREPGSNLSLRNAEIITAAQVLGKTLLSMS